MILFYLLLFLVFLCFYFILLLDLLRLDQPLHSDLLPVPVLHLAPLVLHQVTEVPAVQ